MGESARVPLLSATSPGDALLKEGNHASPTQITGAGGEVSLSRLSHTPEDVEAPRTSLFGVAMVALLSVPSLVGA